MATDSKAITNWWKTFIEEVLKILATAAVSLLVAVLIGLVDFVVPPNNDDFTGEWDLHLDALQGTVDIYQNTGTSIQGIFELNGSNGYNGTVTGSRDSESATMYFTVDNGNDPASGFVQRWIVSGKIEKNSNSAEVTGTAILHNGSSGAVQNTRESNFAMYSLIKNDKWWSKIRAYLINLVT